VAFAVRTISVAPGSSLPYEAAEWRDALLFVESGEIAVDTACGLTWHFHKGDLLTLAGMPVAAIRNPGPEPALLLATERTEGVR
jgi:quercetin dioxygenase-like cupin family protein